MQAGRSLTSVAEILAAFVVWVIICAVIPSSDLRKSSAESGIGLKIFSGLTALGVCVYSAEALAEKVIEHPQILVRLHMPPGMFLCVSLAVSLLAFLSVYMFVIYFWRRLLGVIDSGGLLRDAGRYELAFYVLMFAVSASWMTLVFLRTNVFYDAPGYNVVYSSDSSGLVMGNCFLRLTHPENDIRQPLFAVFSIPFMGLPYLAGKLLSLFVGHGRLLTALFMNDVQTAMLLAGIYILGRAMRLSEPRRVLFAAFFACSYVYLLALVMMEQYIVAFFWLAMAVYSVCNDSCDDRMILHGAGGTLTPSLFVTPLYLCGWGQNYLGG